jgi:hypothetical protein
MKKEDEHITDPMKRWIAEAGTETPREGFHLSVLKKIEALPQRNLVYTPVISPLSWKLILGFISSIFGWCIVMVPPQPATNSLFDRFSELRLPTISFQWYEIAPRLPDLSPNLLLGIGAFFIMGTLAIVGTLYQRQANI